MKRKENPSIIREGLLRDWTWPVGFLAVFVLFPLLIGIFCSPRKTPMRDFASLPAAEHYAEGKRLLGVAEAADEARLARRHLRVVLDDSEQFPDAQELWEQANVLAARMAGGETRSEILNPAPAVESGGRDSRQLEKPRTLRKGVRWDGKEILYYRYKGFPGRGEDILIATFGIRIYVFRTLGDFQRWQGSMVDENILGEQMVREGRAYKLGSRIVRAKVLEVDGESRMARVYLKDGPHRGRTVWVQTYFVGFLPTERERMPPKRTE